MDYDQNRQKCRLPIIIYQYISTRTYKTMIQPNGFNILQATPRSENPPSPRGSVSSRFSSSTQGVCLSIKKCHKFQFSNLDLAYKVRQQLYKILIVYDKNSNMQFQENEIKLALTEILQETPQEILYVVKNVFRYDTNHDGFVTYEQFTNFCLQQHFGQMAIQRLHKWGKYQRGKERLMSNDELYETLNYCLNFIGINPDPNIVAKIFSEIDTKKQGYITYSEYFTFLKEYFGSRSESAVYVKINDMKEEMEKQDSKEAILNFISKKKSLIQDASKNKGDSKEKLERERKQRQKKEKDQWDRKQRQKIQAERKKINEENLKRRQAMQEQERLRKQRAEIERKKNEDERRRQEEEWKKKRQEEEMRRKRLADEQEQKRKRIAEEEQRQRKKRMEEQERARKERDQQNQLRINININNNSENSQQINKLFQRISRLVYHQVKITLLNNDKRYLLHSDRNLATQTLKDDMQMPGEVCSQVIEEHFSRLNRITIPYEQLLEACVSQHMTEYYPKTIAEKFPLNRESFIEQVERGLHFIKAKPIGHILDSIFDHYCPNSTQQELTQNKFKQIMIKIFKDYRWPRKTGQQKKVPTYQQSKYFPHKTDR